MPIASSPPKLRRTKSNTSSRMSGTLTRAPSTHSVPPPPKEIPRSDRPTSILTSPRTPTQGTIPIHVVPQRDSAEWGSPTYTDSNPFEGRLFGPISPVLGGRESHEFLDEVNFNSPRLGSGRGPSHGQFNFQDHDDDEDEYGKVTSPVQKSVYASVDVAENQGNDEEDEFLDEKRKPSKTSKTSRFFSAITPHWLITPFRRVHEKYPRTTKQVFILLFSLIPLFVLAIVILVIVETVAFRPPTIYPANALDTTALEAGSWGFNFSRALNFTMINRSPFAMEMKKIAVSAGLSRGLDAQFNGSGAATLGLPLGTHGNYYTNFILPLEFTYDAAADTNGTTLEALLEGCGLVSGATGNGITLDLSFNGVARVFDMFDRTYETDGIGGVITCDTFLKDAVRIMGQLHGDKLSSK